MHTFFSQRSARSCALSFAGGALAALLTLLPPVATAQTSNSAAKSGAAPAGNVEKGKRGFASHGCNACHGTAGEGSQPFAGGPPIGPPPVSYSAFARYVRLAPAPPRRPERSRTSSSSTCFTDALSAMGAWARARRRREDRRSVRLPFRSLGSPCTCVTLRARCRLTRPRWFRTRTWRTSTPSCRQCPCLPRPRTFLC